MDIDVGASVSALTGTLSSNISSNLLKVIGTGVAVFVIFLLIKFTFRKIRSATVPDWHNDNPEHVDYDKEAQDNF